MISPQNYLPIFDLCQLDIFTLSSPKLSSFCLISPKSYQKYLPLWDLCKLVILTLSYPKLSSFCLHSRKRYTLDKSLQNKNH